MTFLSVPFVSAAVKEDGPIFACLSLCLCMFICFPIRRVFWSGAGRFVLNSLDDGLRTNPGISAREFISFSEESTVKPFCLVRHSPVVLTGLFPGGFDPSYLSFPKVCPAMVVCCFSSRVLWPVFLYSRCSCVHGEPVQHVRLRVFLSGGHGELVMCYRVPGYTFLFFWNTSGCGIWRIIISFFFFRFPIDGLFGAAPLVSVSEPPLSTSALLFGMWFVRAMPTLSVTVVIACKTAAFSVWTLNHAVPSASVI